MATNCRIDFRLTEIAARTLVAASLLAAPILCAPAVAQSPISSNQAEQPRLSATTRSNNPVEAPLPSAPPEFVEKPIGAELDTLGSISLETPRPVFPKSITLKIASWRLASEKGPTTTGSSSESESATSSTWRTTFGSERTTVNWRRTGPAGFEADIIAMQDVTDLRGIRKSFGVRRFHLIASRQLLTRTTETSSGLTVLRSTAPPTTAIAYRRKRGVRIAGVRHFLPPAGVRPEPAAVTAFRLRFFRKMIWVASFDMPSDCPRDMASTTCQQHGAVLARFLAWARRISRQKTPLILVGSWPAHITGELETSGFEIGPKASLRFQNCGRSGSKVLIANPPGGGPIERLTNLVAPKGTSCVATAQLTLLLR